MSLPTNCNNITKGTLDIGIDTSLIVKTLSSSSDSKTLRSLSDLRKCSNDDSILFPTIKTACQYP